MTYVAYPICLWLGSFLISGALAIAVYFLALFPAPLAPSLGYRGVKRRNLVKSNRAFAFIEPIMRLLAGWISGLHLGALRDRVDAFLLRSGDCLGITADEHLALSALSSLLFLIIGFLFSHFTRSDLTFPFLGWLLGAALPSLQIRSITRDRFKEIDRNLPSAIDLAALCMSAGLDFPGAISLIARGREDPAGAVEEELGRILQELEVGHTRKQSLENLSQRAPTESVRAFVAAVIQAEQKGNPLGETLRVQAQMLRMRRSVAAEESATRAGVLMMMPLLLLVCCVLLVLLGPFIVNGIG